MIPSGFARFPAALMHSTKAVLARNVRALMADRQWSERDLAQKSGVSQKAINNLLNQRAAPSSDTIDRIARAFNMQTWQLTLPVEPEQLRDSGRFASLLSHYLVASEQGRTWIARVAEQEAKYRPR